MTFLKRKQNGVTVLNPIDPEIDQTQFLAQDWSEVPYGPFLEDDSSNTPAPMCMGFTVRTFVHCNHTSDSVSRRSRT